MFGLDFISKIQTNANHELCCLDVSAAESGTRTLFLPQDPEFCYIMPLKSNFVEVVLFANIMDFE